MIYKNSWMDGVKSWEQPKMLLEASRQSMKLIVRFVQSKIVTFSNRIRSGQPPLYPLQSHTDVPRIVDDIFS